MSFIKSCFRTMRTPENGHTDFSHPNAVYLYRDEQSEDKKLRRRKMYNDTWEQDYMEFVEGNALLCAAVLHIAERRTGWRTPSGCML